MNQSRWRPDMPIMKMPVPAAPVAMIEPLFVSAWLSPSNIEMAVVPPVIVPVLMIEFPAPRSRFPARSP